nr:hypothetical protein [Legionella santicrucis]
MTAALTAVIHPSILKLVRITAAMRRMIAFNTNVNRPRVRILIGSVRIKRIGFIIAFRNPMTKLAIIAALKSLRSKPFTNLEVIRRAIAEKIQIKITFNLIDSDEVYTLAS